ncbi:MAG: cupin domain-containing protein [Acidimicrobiales bacterium]
MRAPSPWGPEDISVVRQVYDPGQDSGWHAHSGIHAVAVLSGALTVYDLECRVQTVEPGSPYVGGQQAHRVRNETAEPVDMIVSYLSPRAAADSTRHISASAC